MPITSTIPPLQPRRFKAASHAQAGAVTAADPKKAAAQAAPKAAAETAGAKCIIGLAPMTRVRTSFGDFPAQTLRERDRVLTKTGAYLPIVSLRRITLDEDYLRYHPDAQPVIIRAGAYQMGIPKAEVALAPFQKLDKSQPFIMAGNDRAINSMHRPAVFRRPEKIITYTLISLGKPASINCEGLWVALD